MDEHERKQYGKRIAELEYEIKVIGIILSLTPPLNLRVVYFDLMFRQTAS